MASDQTGNVTSGQWEAKSLEIWSEIRSILNTNRQGKHLSHEQVIAAVRHMRERLKLGLREAREMVNAMIEHNSWKVITERVEKRLAQLADVEEAKAADVEEAKAADVEEAKAADVEEAKAADVEEAKTAERKTLRYCPPDMLVPYTAAAAACRSVCGYKVGKANQGGRDRKTMEKRFGSAGTIRKKSVEKRFGSAGTIRTKSVRCVMAVCLQKVIVWCMRHETARYEARYPDVMAWRGILRDALVYYGTQPGAIPPVLQATKVVEHVVHEAPKRADTRPGPTPKNKPAIPVKAADLEDKRHRQAIAVLGEIRSEAKSMRREFRSDLEQLQKRVRDLLSVQERTLEAIERVHKALAATEPDRHVLNPAGLVIHVHGECHVTANEKPEVIGVPLG